MRPVPILLWSLLAGLLVLAACGGDKSESGETVDDGSDEGTGDEGGDEGGDDGGSDDGGSDDGGSDDGGESDHVAFDKIYDDVFMSGPVRSWVTLDVVASASAVSGSVSYIEGAGDQDWNTCQATLDLAHVATNPNCADCTWSWTFQLELADGSRSNGCVFPSPSTSFGLGDGGYLGTLSHRATGPGGTQNVVTIGAMSADGWSEHTLYAEDSEGNAIVNDWGSSSGIVQGVTITALADGDHVWDGCEAPEELLGTTTTGPPTGGTEVPDSIDCTLGTGLVDVWEAEVTAGQTIKAAVDSSGEDPIMWLVDPQGCMLEAIDDSVACSDDRPLCPAILHTAAQDGKYRLVVGPRYCFDQTMNYFIDGAVQ